MGKGINHNLPRNENLKQFAKENRVAGNLSEALLWLQIKKGKLNGLDFDRQVIIGNYIVDFYCAEKKAVVEIDGITHDEKTEYDKKRDAYLESLGLTLFHVTDIEVKTNLQGVIDYLGYEIARL